MKFSKILILSACVLCALPSFGQEKTDKDKDLYDFVAPVVETKIDEKEDKKEDTKDANLIADAQTLIRDKLVQKYQVRLDEVIDRLTGRLGTSSASAQREALGDLKKTMSDRKTLVVTRKDLDPLKRDLLIALLDHVIYRIDGIIKQSAHIENQKPKA